MVDSVSDRQEALGQSEIFLDFQDRLSRVAPVDRPVLLLGERGTGKELAARRLHFLSKRWEGPFVTLNCATLSPTLIESELFGHERGAYTGAEGRRIGRFEAASGGTLFLDEIGTIPIQAQEKILRVVEYHFFERVGSSEHIEVDVRIICATNADLPALAAEGKFKQDLLDRLSFEVLFLPPLRRRGEDIMLLARHFGSRMLFELGIDEDLSFSSEAERSLEGHQWSGNVRELKNVVERAVYRAGSGFIEEIDFNTGRVLDALKANGVDENTLVIFTSDNGPWLIKGEHGGSAKPLRDGKGSSYEGGENRPQHGHDGDQAVFERVNYDDRALM